MPLSIAGPEGRGYMIIPMSNNSHTHTHTHTHNRTLICWVATVMTLSAIFFISKLFGFCSFRYSYSSFSTGWWKVELPFSSISANRDRI